MCYNSLGKGDISIVAIKEASIETIKRLPDECSIEDMMEKTPFHIAKIYSELLLPQARYRSFIRLDCFKSSLSPYLMALNCWKCFT